MSVFNSQLAGCSVWTVGCHTPGWPPPDPGRRTQARGLSVGRAGAAQPGWSFRGPLPGGGPHRHPPHPASSPPGGDGGPPGPGSPGAASGGASASCRPPPAAPEPHPALALGAPTLLEGLGDESHSGSAPGLGPWDPQLSTTATSSAAAWPAGPALGSSAAGVSLRSGRAVGAPRPRPCGCGLPEPRFPGASLFPRPRVFDPGLAPLPEAAFGPPPAPRPCDLVARGDAPFHVATAGRTRRRKPASATRARPARARVCLFRKQRSFRKLCRLRQRLLGSSLSLTSKRT